MALGTGGYLLALVVRLVTGKTLGLEAMGSMAGLTGDLAMLAGELDQLLLGPGMTITARSGKALGHGNFLGEMGIMTGSAILYRSTMGQIVTGAAFGHQGIPPTLGWIVSMKGLMAVTAIKTMFAAIILQVAEITGMTLSALGNGQGLGIGRIQLGLYRNINRGHFLFTLRGCHCNCHRNHQNQDQLQS